MELNGKKFVSLYLTDWQMRMVKDVLGVDCHHYTFPVEGPPVLRYMAPRDPGVDRAAKRMYLTEWQRREIKDETGHECEFIELKPGAVMKYMGPPIKHMEELIAKPQP
jgi:hypothetical protein